MHPIPYSIPSHPNMQTKAPMSMHPNTFPPISTLQMQIKIETNPKKKKIPNKSNTFSTLLLPRLPAWRSVPGPQQPHILPHTQRIQLVIALAPRDNVALLLAQQAPQLGAPAGEGEPARRPVEQVVDERVQGGHHGGQLAQQQRREQQVQHVDAEEPFGGAGVVVAAAAVGVVVLVVVVVGMLVWRLVMKLLLWQ
ncbi:hypothetical protein HDK77DRAFT_445490 [Phyllosticta capitalensis]